MAGDYLAGLRCVRGDVLVLLVLLWQPRGRPHRSAGVLHRCMIVCLLALYLCSFSVFESLLCTTLSGTYTHVAHPLMTTCAVLSCARSLVWVQGGGSPGEPVVYQRGPHWFEAQRLNSLLKIYGNFLLGRKSVGVYRASSDTTVGVPYHVDQHPWNGTSTTEEPTEGMLHVLPVPAADCAIAGISNSGLRAGVEEPADFLIGQFSLVGAPRWGPSAAARPVVPPTHTLAVLLQNQDESRNVWSTVHWAIFINASSIMCVLQSFLFVRTVQYCSPWGCVQGG